MSVVSPPPIQEYTSTNTQYRGLFPQVWIRWFGDVCDAIIVNNFAAISVPAVTSDVTLNRSDSTVLCDTSSNVITITLPDALEFSGFKFNIKKVNIGSNDVTVDGDGAEIDGSATVLLSGSGMPAITIHSDGTGWWIL